MNQDEFASKFGKLVINLKSMEFIARIILGNKFKDPPLPKHINSYNIGDVIPKGYLTEYRGFGNVLEKFNKEFEFDLDIERIRLLRNAVGHGRLSALVPNGIMLMFNTKKFDASHVQLEWIANLDEAWFKSENDYVMNVLNRMIELHKTQN